MRHHHPECIRKEVQANKSLKRDSSPDDLVGGFSDMPVDMHRGSRHYVPHSFLRQVTAVDEGPPNRIDKLLSVQSNG